MKYDEKKWSVSILPSGILLNLVLDFLLFI